MPSEFVGLSVILNSRCPVKNLPAGTSNNKKISDTIGWYPEISYLEGIEKILTKIKA